MISGGGYIFLGLCTVGSAIRVISGGEQDAPITTKFQVRGLTYETGSWLQCVAREGLRVKLPDGHSREVAAGELLAGKVNVTADTNTKRFNSRWGATAGKARWQIAILELELFETGRRAPHFDCGVENEHSGRECEATSNHAAVQKDENCIVEIKNESPWGRAEFIIAASSIVAARVECHAATNLHIRERPLPGHEEDDPVDREVSKGAALFVETTLAFDEFSNYSQTNIQVDFTNFNPKYDGFVCRVYSHGDEQPACEASSWNCKQTSFQNTDCEVFIVFTSFTAYDLEDPGREQETPITTTKFQVRGLTYKRGSWLECVAREDLRVKDPDGQTSEVAAGELLAEKRYVQVDTNAKSFTFFPGWGAAGALAWFYVKQIASLEFELVDTGRRMPHFDCGVENKYSGRECGAISNHKISQTDQNCIVEIKDKNPSGRAEFVIAASSIVAARVECHAATNLHIRERPLPGQEQNDSVDHVMLKGAPLFGGKTLAFDEFSNYSQTHIQLDFMNFNPKYDGFVCKVFPQNETQQACEASSWNCKQTGFQDEDCEVFIVLTSFTPYARLD